MIAEHIENGKATFLLLGEPNIDFIGYRLRDLCLAYQFTNWMLTPESQVRIGNFNENELSDPIFLEWVGTKDSDLIITLRKHNPEGPGVIIFPSR